jgi:hypothetical protein
MFERLARRNSLAGTVILLQTNDQSACKSKTKSPAI